MDRMHQLWSNLDLVSPQLQS